MNIANVETGREASPTDMSWETVFYFGGLQCKLVFVYVVLIFGLHYQSHKVTLSDY
jgi:hypothetical protein